MTYISPLQPALFHKVFGHEPIRGIHWDKSNTKAHQQIYWSRKQVMSKFILSTAATRKVRRAHTTPATHPISVTVRVARIRSIIGIDRRRSLTKPSTLLVLPIRRLAQETTAKIIP